MPGSTALRAPLDYAAMAGFGLANFVLSFIGYWRPNGSMCWTIGSLSRCGIFDELYFARAGEEYLQNLRIYENTHPPLSKLLITLSMMLFGGMPKGHGLGGWTFLNAIVGHASSGDNPYGWRFLDVVFGALTVMLLYAFARRVTGSTAFASLAALLLTVDGMHFVQSRLATPEGFVVFFATLATYAFYRFWIAPERSARGWLIVFSVALGCLVSTKWYGVMGFGLSFGAIAATAIRPDLAARWGKPRLRPGIALVAIVVISATIYALVWVPDLVRQSPDPNEIHTIGDVVARQKQMFDYHATLKATHPYSSKWWEWPLDLVPVAYFYQDRRVHQSDPGGCCIVEITSMPNPAILWFGLLCVPLTGAWAWRERNAGYALIVLAILLQWLPWMASPRITFAYHFYVNVPLICLCNAIALQHFWQWGRTHRHRGNAVMAAIVAGAYACAAAGAFAFFYPILAAQPLTWAAWHARMWLPTWIIGPG